MHKHKHTHTFIHGHTYTQLHMYTIIHECMQTQLQMHIFIHIITYTEIDNGDIPRFEFYHRKAIQLGKYIMTYIFLIFGLKKKENYDYSDYIF